MGWEYFLILILSSVISIALAPKPKAPDPAVFEDFVLPQVDEGTPQIVLFGDCWLEGWMVLSYGNLRIEEITDDSGKGKK